MSHITDDFRVAAMRYGMLIQSANRKPATEAIQKAAFIEMANLGFNVRLEDLDMSETALTQMIRDARKVVGDDRVQKPVYPGFPKQVQELSTLTMLVEQILHYWTAGAFLPAYPDEVRPGLPLSDFARAPLALRAVKAGVAGREVLEKFVLSTIALSEGDQRLLLGAYAVVMPSLEEVADLAGRAKNGENMQHLVTAAAVIGCFPSSDLVSAIVPRVHTLDGVLRVVLAVCGQRIDQSQGTSHKVLSDSDLNAQFERAVKNLSDKDGRAVKLRNLNRSARRALVQRVSELSGGFHADRLVARELLWRRVMRMVHPYDLTLDVESKRAMDIIHGNVEHRVEHRTLAAAVEASFENGDASEVVRLMSENSPGMLLRSVVRILRVADADGIKALVKAVREQGSRSTVTTLISAYNGVLNANSERDRVIRVAGRSNAMVSSADRKKVSEKHVNAVLGALSGALSDVLAKKAAPVGTVGVTGSEPVPLVRRDLSTSDRALERGSRLAPVGKGDTLRMFSHFVNNQKHAGYMDIGVVLLNEKFEQVSVCTWNTWSITRDWATYSGDTYVPVGDSASEFIDVSLKDVRRVHSSARYVAMTIQSWSGWKMGEVDLIAGVMYRSAPGSGEVFDARTVATAFKPTTDALSAVPVVYELKEGHAVWLDSSSGSNQSGVSAANDTTVGDVVYDGIAREQMSMGDLAELWADAHDAETDGSPVDRDVVMALLD